MTDLQIGLLTLGATTVAGVLIYNKFQEHQHRKLAEKMMAADHDDVLLGRGRRRPVAEPEPQPDDEEPEIPPEYDTRREPMMESLAMEDDEIQPVVFAEEPLDEVTPTVDAPNESSEAVISGLSEEIAAQAVGLGEQEPLEPVISESPAEASATPTVIEVETVAAPAPTPTPTPTMPSFQAAEPSLPVGEVPIVLLDPRIDFIVVMELVDAVPALQILHSQRDALKRISKPVTWVGFNDRNREWETLMPEEAQSYRRLRVGLQLADRRGPVSDTEFSIFVTAMQLLSDELMAVADMPVRHGVLDHALGLDRFCAAVDLEIGVNLVTRGSPFTGTKIRALAEAAGMLLAGGGRFTRFDDAGQALFSLQNLESMPFASESMKNTTTHGLTFVLDVPRVAHGERVFFQMVDLARRSADTLQGLLVDDNRQPLSESQLDQIKREYIIKPQASMAQYGIPAGSPQAQRLFS